MPPAEPMDADLFIRDGLRATRPERRPNWDKIDARATQLRWRTRTRVAGALAAMVAVVVGIAAALPADDAGPSVRIEESPTKPNHPVPPSPSSTVRATTTTSTTTTSTPPVTNPDPANVPPPVVTPVIPVVPTTALPTTTTTTTKPSAARQFPPVAPNAFRLLVVLDDDGLHAKPGTFMERDEVEILYVDERTNSGPIARLYSVEGDASIPEWDGHSTIPITGLSNGTYHFRALDEHGDVISGANLTIVVTVNPDEDK